jgi:phage tail sheath protein FI
MVASSPTYNLLMTKVSAAMNLLPPSGAIAGVYTSVDNNNGVWKAPANVSLNSVDAPSADFNRNMTDNLNVDAVSGKSINAIRSFPGQGTLVFGARTLDGNSQDWRYISVRRTLIMMEQSIKVALRAYVFEPNDDSTWITVKSMITNFLTNLWKQGALAGAKPEDAFQVMCGLNVTMTAQDILDGYMRITVLVAVVHPAEFIVLTFQQELQTS